MKQLALEGTHKQNMIADIDEAAPAKAVSTDAASCGSLSDDLGDIIGTFLKQEVTGQAEKHVDP